MRITLTTTEPPHVNTQVLVREPTDAPTKALVLMHGRGSSAENIMRLLDHMALTPDIVVLAPQAEGYEWYPERFIESRTKNEPGISSSYGVLRALIGYCQATYGLSQEQVVLAGFSQGACLVADFVMRNPMRYGGVGVFSGGLIGTSAEVGTIGLGDMQGTPVYVGCDRADAHIPLERVEKTAELFMAFNTHISLKLYDGLGHSVHPEGIKFLQQCLTETTAV